MAAHNCAQRALLLACCASAWRATTRNVAAPPSSSAWRHAPAPLAPPSSRRGFFSAAAAGAASLAARRAAAAEPKQAKLPAAVLAKIVTADVTERQFLATADFTRSLYDESATFTDEIDTYTIDKFIKGTKKLFVAERSRVDLDGPVTVDDGKAEFKFKETLCFNLPFVKPTVFVSGRVVLTRDPASGLFTAYREYWDQTPNEVIRKAKL